MGRSKIHESCRLMDALPNVAVVFDHDCGSTDGGGGIEFSQSIDGLTDNLKLTLDPRT